MVDCRHAPTPYRSGLVYDCIVPDGTELSPKARAIIITQYQSLIGALNWLAVSTHPDVSVALTLLAQHNSYATPAHLLGAKYVLRYLPDSADHGIAFTSQFASSYLSTTFGWPKDTPTLTTYTDANWGPQDASKPNPTDIISLAECCSLLGSISTRTGGPIAWHVIREPRVSRSTCESEIKSADEGTKVTQFIRHLLSDLHMPDVTLPTPLWNDNRGAVDWSHNCANKKRCGIFISATWLCATLTVFPKSLSPTSQGIPMLLICSPKNIKMMPIFSASAILLSRLMGIFSLEGGVGTIYRLLRISYQDSCKCLIPVSTGPSTAS